MRPIDLSKFDDPQAVLRELPRRDFRWFLLRAYPAISGGEYLNWNWHLDAIAYELDQIARGNSRRLLITMPPRNLKSITTSIAWVAWMLGQDPRRNFVCVSYSNDLSGKLARDCLAIMQSSWYMELFPRTIISAKRFTASDFTTTMQGGRLATSITGTLTGRGGDIIIIDDPIKPDEAHSETAREAVNNWYRSTLASRLNDKATGAIVTVMQRLHQNDLAGVLQEQGGWRNLSLPAIATESQTIPLLGVRTHVRQVGDILHPSRESLATLELQRAMMGSTDFAAQYQQDPVPAGGNTIKVYWLKTYPPSFVPELPGIIVQSWDTANKDNPRADYSVCTTAHVRGREVRILHVFRAKLDFPELKHMAIHLAREYRAGVLLIEDQASGTQLLSTLRSEQPRGVPSPIGRRPEGNKVSRMEGVSAQVEAGDLMLPEDASWLAEFKSELCAFPHGKNDDQADSLSQLMIWVRDRESIDLQPLGSSFCLTADH